MIVRDKAHARLGFARVYQDMAQLIAHKVNED